MSLLRASLFFVASVSLGCQSYPFELREPSRVNATEITEVVAQLTPADILFVVDNSGSMGEEITELQNNLDLFLDSLSQSENDFQIGIVTTDMECNIPENDCDLANPTTSIACCQQLAANPSGLCEERDQDADGVIETSTCDGGRLRSATPGGRRVFPRPSAADRDAWIAEVNQAIDLARNNLNGSTMEAGLAAVNEAVACAVGDPECATQAVADLNQGFIRDEADLVVIFLTDEDDCSVPNPLVWDRADTTNPIAQRTQFCGALDCYAYYGDGDLNTNGVHDFIDEGASGGSFSGLICDDGTKRTENPPGLASVEGLLDTLVTLKGGDVSAIRGAGILSATSVSTAALGFEANGCFGRTTGPSADCGCLAGSPLEAYCYVTDRNGQSPTRLPVGSGGTFSGGCSSMPGGRYARFLELLAVRRVEAFQSPDVLVDSICRDRYDETLVRIVNNVILSNCFDLGRAPASLGAVQVTYNGSTLPNVELDGSQAGWSWIEGSQEICLEGGLSKSINDRVEIVLLASE